MSVSWFCLDNTSSGKDREGSRASTGTCCFLKGQRGRRSRRGGVQFLSLVRSGYVLLLPDDWELGNAAGTQFLRESAIILQTDPRLAQVRLERGASTRLCGQAALRRSLYRVRREGELLRPQPERAMGIVHVHAVSLSHGSIPETSVSFPKTVHCAGSGRSELLAALGRKVSGDQVPRHARLQAHRRARPVRVGRSMTQAPATVRLVRGLWRVTPSA